MSVVFTCRCGVKTVNPFMIKGERYCTVCAEDLAPHIVEQREHQAYRLSHREDIAWRKVGRFNGRKGN